MEPASVTARPEGAQAVRLPVAAVTVAVTCTAPLKEILFSLFFCRGRWQHRLRVGKPSQWEYNCSRISSRMSVDPLLPTGVSLIFKDNAVDDLEVVIETDVFA